MANYYVIRIKFHWGFSYVTNYMKHSFLRTRRVISSIITRNFFMTRNKQPMTIGTSRMCISRDDNCANTMCFPRQLQPTARKLFTTICFRCFLRRVWYELSFLVSYFVMNFLRRIFSVCRSFRNMCQSGRMKGFERCFKVEDQGTWRRQNLHAAILRPPAKMIQIKLYEPHLGKEKPVMGNIEPLLGITKPAEGLNKPCQGNVNGRKSFAAEGFNGKIPFISQTYTSLPRRRF